MSAPAGLLVPFLHAHLPFVRHPEHEDFLEEGWLFEAITECYLPLLGVFEGWAQDRLPVRLGMSLSPTLVSMLGDDLLGARYRRRLERLEALAGREVARRPVGTAARAAAEAQRDRLVEVGERLHALGGDLVGAFARLEAKGVLELATCAVTHAFLPLYAPNPRQARPHVRAAVRAHRAAFGRHPAGMWLPECGFAPGLDAVLADEGLAYFFVDAHAVAYADPPPVFGIHAPLVTPAGPVAFGRDPDASRAVWSSEDGYPGGPDYREFHRDLGFDLPEDRPLGLKYHRVTGRDVPLSDKADYEPAAARAAAERDAATFVARCRGQAEALLPILGRAAVIAAPFDAELFGHWWYEGPEFLDAVIRAAASAPGLDPCSPGQAIARAGSLEVSTPAASSWGSRGYGEVWLNPGNDWIWPRLHRDAATLRGVVDAHPAADGVLARALAQLAREHLLACASDWSFMITMGTTVAYAEARVRSHLERFADLAEQLRRGRIDEPALASLEAADNLLADLDYRDFATEPR